MVKILNLQDALHNAARPVLRGAASALGGGGPGHSHTHTTALVAVDRYTAGATALIGMGL